jgi:hypothetical protein
MPIHPDILSEVWEIMLWGYVLAQRETGWSDSSNCNTLLLSSGTLLGTKFPFLTVLDC